MDMAKPGLIKEHCDPNALSTFLEYLQEYASEATKQAGFKLIEKTLNSMDDEPKTRSTKMLEAVRSGKRDVYC